MSKDSKSPRFKLEGEEKDFRELIALFAKIPMLKVSASFDKRFKEKLKSSKERAASQSFLDEITERCIKHLNSHHPKANWSHSHTAMGTFIFRDTWKAKYSLGDEPFPALRLYITQSGQGNVVCVAQMRYGLLEGDPKQSKLPASIFEMFRKVKPKQINDKSRIPPLTVGRTVINAPVGFDHSKPDQGFLKKSWDDIRTKFFQSPDIKKLLDFQG